jgi:hypothetical protein
VPQALTVSVAQISLLCCLGLLLGFVCLLAARPAAGRQCPAEQHAMAVPKAVDALAQPVRL